MDPDALQQHCDVRFDKTCVLKVRVGAPFWNPNTVHGPLRVHDYNCSNTTSNTTSTTSSTTRNVYWRTRDCLHKPALADSRLTFSFM